MSSCLLVKCFQICIQWISLFLPLKDCIVLVHCPSSYSFSSEVRNSTEMFHYGKIIHLPTYENIPFLLMELDALLFNWQLSNYCFVSSLKLEYITSLQSNSTGAKQTHNKIACGIFPPRSCSPKVCFGYGVPQITAL